MGTIYMLLCRPYIKLGFTSKNFADYLQWIRNRIPFQVDVLATRPGTKEDEADLLKGAHEWQHCYGGKEWFVDCLELRVYCDAFFFADRKIVPELSEGTLSMEPETL